MEKYNFLTIEGKLLDFNSMKDAGNYFRQQGVNLGNSHNINSFWEYLNHLESDGQPSQEEIRFLKKYNLGLTIWNIGVLQKIKAVYLYPLKLEELKKGGLVCMKRYI